MTLVAAPVLAEKAWWEYRTTDDIDTLLGCGEYPDLLPAFRPGGNGLYIFRDSRAGTVLCVLPPIKDDARHARQIPLSGDKSNENLEDTSSMCEVNRVSGCIPFSPVVGLVLLFLF